MANNNVGNMIKSALKIFFIQWIARKLLGRRS